MENEVPATLDDIYARYDADPGFTHLRKGSKQIVRGEGPTDPLAVIIGERPGPTENNYGVPFRGPAGDYLNELLEGIGTARSDVYLTNIIKYMLREGREPTWGEVMRSVNYVREELETLDCKVVVTLGRHALSAFFPEYQLTDVHGKVLVGDTDLYLVPTYHPSVGLYNERMKDTIAADFRSIGEAIDLSGNSEKELV